MNELKVLKQKAKTFNIYLDDEQLYMFRVYAKYLEEYNAHTNLISKNDVQNNIFKHFTDSLAIGLLSAKIDFSQETRLVDIGIGGGFPGIPIIIAYKNWKLCAVDSVGKKINFIKSLAEKLDIEDRVETVQTRAEELARMPDKREQFDIAITRAVATMNIIAEYCLPMVKPKGHFIAYKAKTADEELKESKKAISLLGGEFISKENYNINNEIEDRNLLLIRKESHTPEQYPRKTGIPTKKPIK